MHRAPAAAPVAPVAVDPPIDPARKFPKLAELIGYLTTLKGRADLSVLATLLKRVNITRLDIEEICVFGSRNYKRNTIARSDHFELLALCWRSGHCTPIHDHEGSSCAFKVIAGTGTEIRFEKTPSSLIRPVATNQMDPSYICAANDPDIHQVANMQAPGVDLITLHIYSPPIKSMNTYRFADPSIAPVEYGSRVRIEPVDDWYV